MARPYTMRPMMSQQACPICGMSFIGSGLKYHIKTCAKRAGSQLGSCPHCVRPILHDDLAEHKKRCVRQWDKRSLPDDSRKRYFAEKQRILRSTLAKVEAGELGKNLDKRGFFQCSICGLEGLTLDTILDHEAACRQGLASNGDVPLAQNPPEVMEFAQPVVAEASGLAGQLQAAVAQLRNEISTAYPVAGADGDALPVCLERLRVLMTNACQKEERKYRKLKRSNVHFQEAVGRWSSAVDFMRLIGFYEEEQASKSGELESVIVLQDQLPEEMLQIALQALSDAPPVPPPVVPDAASRSSSPQKVPSTPMAYEECAYCGRRFRFDRIAKHETRCMSGKPKPSKFDAVSNALQATPAACYIPTVKREMMKAKSEGGFKLPKLSMNQSSVFVPNSECKYCGRRFNAEALAKHIKHCKATGPARPRDSAGRPPSSGPSSARPSSSGPGSARRSLQSLKDVKSKEPASSSSSARPRYADASTTGASGTPSGSASVAPSESSYDGSGSRPRSSSRGKPSSRRSDPTASLAASGALSGTRSRSRDGTARPASAMTGSSGRPPMAQQRPPSAPAAAESDQYNRPPLPRMAEVVEPVAPPPLRPVAQEVPQYTEHIHTVTAWEETAPIVETAHSVPQYVEPVPAPPSPSRTKQLAYEDLEIDPGDLFGDED